MAFDLKNAFSDLATRTSMFRNLLIEEFHLLDNLSFKRKGAPLAPVYSSKDLKGFDEHRSSPMLVQTALFFKRFLSMRHRRESR